MFVKLSFSSYQDLNYFQSRATAAGVVKSQHCVSREYCHCICCCFGSDPTFPSSSKFVLLLSLPLLPQEVRNQDILMYSSIYKHFQSAATLTARLFSFLQVYLFSDHSVYYSSLRIISAGLCQCCFGGGPEGRVGGWSFSGSVQPWASYTDCDLHL